VLDVLKQSMIEDQMATIDKLQHKLAELHEENLALKNQIIKDGNEFISNQDRVTEIEGRLASVVDENKLLKTMIRSLKESVDAEAKRRVAAMNEAKPVPQNQNLHKQCELEYSRMLDNYHKVADMVHNAEFELSSAMYYYETQGNYQELLETVRRVQAKLSTPWKL
jgi:predicted  nucleic acid-binding Zn-ribbon protein